VIGDRRRAEHVERREQRVQQQKQQSKDSEKRWPTDHECTVIEILSERRRQTVRDDDTIVHAHLAAAARATPWHACFGVADARKTI